MLIPIPAPVERPRFNGSGLSDDEACHINHVASLVSQLWTIEREIAAAMHLFEYSNYAINQTAAAHSQDRNDPAAKYDHRAMWSWPFIAARNIAIQIHHFGQLPAAIGTSAKDSKILSELVRWKFHAQAKKVFRQKHPNTAMLRDAVSHAAESSATPEAVATYTATIDDSGPAFFIHCCLFGSHLEYSAKGQLWKLEITRENICGNLVQVCNLIANAFENVEPELARPARAAWTERATNRNNNPAT